METIVHFGHDQHRLAFRDEDENEEPKLHTCSICDLPMLSSPSYTCTSSNSSSSQGFCKFSVHEACAQLPHTLHHPHYPSGVVSFLTQKNPTFHANVSLQKSPRPGGPHNCQACHKPCRGFTYTCCEIDIHPLCARPDVVIKTKHESHNAHPLVALCRETMSLCNACEDEHYGFFFFCQECNFWIHRDCTLLPSAVTLASHPHPLILTYTLLPYRSGDKICDICEKERLGRGVYSCSQCAAYVAHIKCVKSKNMEILTSGNKLIPQLPDEGTTFPSLIIRKLENKERIDDYRLPTEEYHNHPLVFYDNTTKHENQEIREFETCNACIQPVSSPFWGCARRPDCNFILHNFCKENIPYKIQNSLSNYRDPLVLHPTAHNIFFHSVFACFLCLRPYGGFSYHTGSPISSSSSSFSYGHPCDLECVASPRTIRHASHGKHVLFHTGDILNHVQKMGCCSDRYRHIVYKCALCSDFKIHIGCALLPTKVRHKFDKHPIELIFTNTGGWVEKDCCFCEFCEQDIDQRYWFYHCVECDQSFHIKCIPSVGFLSKIKFGGTVDVPCHPRHPVALTRMLMESDQRCGWCKEIIHGFVDDMAFYCSECEFWIHFGCARDCCFDGDDQAEPRPLLWYEYKSQRESALPVALT